MKRQLTELASEGKIKTISFKNISEKFCGWGGIFLSAKFFFMINNLAC